MHNLMLRFTHCYKRTQYTPDIYTDNDKTVEFTILRIAPHTCICRSVIFLFTQKSISSFSKTIYNFLRSVSTQDKFEMVHISRTPVQWTVSRNILLIHELSHGQKMQMKIHRYFFLNFIKYLVIHISLLLPIKINNFTRFLF